MILVFNNFQNQGIDFTKFQQPIYLHCNDFNISWNQFHGITKVIQKLSKRWNYSRQLSSGFPWFGHEIHGENLRKAHSDGINSSPADFAMNGLHSWVKISVYCTKNTYTQQFCLLVESFFNFVDFWLVESPEIFKLLKHSKSLTKTQNMN